MNLTRRDLCKFALAAFPAARLLAKPDSNWRSVQVGINAPYTFHEVANAYDEVLAAIVKLGISATANYARNLWSSTWAFLKTSSQSCRLVQAAGEHRPRKLRLASR